MKKEKTYQKLERKRLNKLLGTYNMIYKRRMLRTEKWWPQKLQRNLHIPQQTKVELHMPEVHMEAH